MTFVSWIRYLRGSVRFSARGGFCERFINLCNVRGIQIRALKVHEDGLTGYVCRKDYRRLRPIARSAGMVLRATEKHGISFFLERHKKRRGLLLGALLFSLCLFLLSFHIWSIDAVGTQNVSKETLLQLAETYGLRSGVARRKIDAETLARQVQHDLGGKLSWLAVNIDGCRAFIEARDYIQPDKDETFGDPCNLVADFDGVLRAIEVHSGKKANTEGNGVHKGDLLISGVIENRIGESFFYEARGIVTAEHKDTVRRSTSLSQPLQTYRTLGEVRGIHCFGVPLQFGLVRKKTVQTVFTKTRQLVLNGIPLPVLTNTRTCAKLCDANAEPSVRAALLFDDFTAACYQKYGNTAVLSKKVTVRCSGDQLHIRQDSSCLDFMGTKQPITITPK